MVLEDIHAFSSEASFVFEAISRFANRLANWDARFFTSSGGWIFNPCSQPSRLSLLESLDMESCF